MTKEILFLSNLVINCTILYWNISEFTEVCFIIMISKLILNVFNVFS